jgi:phospholipase/carboxylesterase
VFVPQAYEPGYPYPLLVWLPDRGGRAFELGRAMARVSLRNFIAVEPVGTTAEADCGEAVWDAIEAVRERLSVHADRVYLVGVGAGGTQAFRIACRQPEAFAGVVSLGGGFPLDEGLFARVAPLRRLTTRPPASASTARCGCSTPPGRRWRCGCIPAAPPCRSPSWPT